MKRGGNWVEVSQVELRSLKPQNQSGSFREVRFFLPLVQLFEQLLSAHCVLDSVLTYWGFKEKRDVSSERFWFPRDTHTRVLETPWGSSPDSPSFPLWSLLLRSPGRTLQLIFSFPALCLSLTTVHNYVFTKWMCCIEFISHVPQFRSEWSCSALNFSLFGVCLLSFSTWDSW